jgi:hypothetical protein
MRILGYLNVEINSAQGARRMGLAEFNIDLNISPN